MRQPVDLGVVAASGSKKRSPVTNSGFGAMSKPGSDAGESTESFYSVETSSGVLAEDESEKYEMILMDVYPCSMHSRLQLQS